MKHRVRKIPIRTNANDYFSKSAEEYAARNTSALWQWQRNRELTAVRTLLGDVEGLDVLDLGCGAGFYTQYCLEQRAREVFAVDFSSKMVNQLPNNRVTAIVADAKEFQLDKPVAKILCAGLLEFVTSPHDVLSNARSLIAPGGIMVCLVPPDNFAGRLYRKFHQGHGFNISLFTESNFTQLAQRSRWHVDKLISVFPYSSVYRLISK
jgi:SAM-dependent methyltransferase